MDTLALESFIAVADEGSFSRAAERLFVTQPAISKRIAGLEQDLGMPLFDRQGRQLSLTEAGATLLTSARRIVADLNTSREAILSMGDQVGGRLRLATSHHIGIHRLPPVLKAFTQRYPAVELDLLFLDSELAIDKVIQGEIELAIVTLPETEQRALTNVLIWPDPLVIVAAPDHPLIKTAQPRKGAGAQSRAGALTKKQPVSALASHAAVLPSRNTITRRILFNSLNPHRITIRTALETNYLETIKMLVSVGIGWGVLPASMLDDTVEEVRLSQLDMQRRLGYVVRTDRTISRAGNALLDILRASEPN